MSEIRFQTCSVDASKDPEGHDFTGKVHPLHHRQKSKVSRSTEQAWRAHLKFSTIELHQPAVRKEEGLADGCCVEKLTPGPVLLCDLLYL